MRPPAAPLLAALLTLMALAPGSAAGSPARDAAAAAGAAFSRIVRPPAPVAARTVAAPPRLTIASPPGPAIAHPSRRADDCRGMSLGDPFHRPYGWSGWGPGYGCHDPFLQPVVVVREEPVRPPSGYAWMKLVIRPKDAEVYIDDALEGQVRSYDGYPGLLVIKEGEHQLTIRSGDRVLMDEKIRAASTQTIIIRRDLRESRR